MHAIIAAIVAVLLSLLLLKMARRRRLLATPGGGAATLQTVALVLALAGLAVYLASAVMRATRRTV